MSILAWVVSYLVVGLLTYLVLCLELSHYRGDGIDGRTCMLSFPAIIMWPIVWFVEALDRCEKTLDWFFSTIARFCNWITKKE